MDHMKRSRMSFHSPYYHGKRRDESAQSLRDAEADVARTTAGRTARRRPPGDLGSWSVATNSIGLPLLHRSAQYRGDFWD